MRRLAQAPNLAIATVWVHALREEGVAATVQREFLGAVMGQLPPDQCLPEIWIDDEAQFDLARRLLHELQHRPQRSMQLQATIQENTLTLGDGVNSIDVELLRWK